MKPHIRIYMQHFGYGEQDTILCEWCCAKANDVHHIDRRGMGGSKQKDYIENLVCLCRFCHEAAHKHQSFNEKVRQRHLNVLRLFKENAVYRMFPDRLMRFLRSPGDHKTKIIR